MGLTGKQMKMRMVGFYLLFSLLPLLGLTDAGQEAIQLSSFSEPSPSLHGSSKLEPFSPPTRFAPAPGSALAFAPAAPPSELPYINSPFTRPLIPAPATPPAGAALPPLLRPPHRHRRAPRAPVLPLYPPPAPPAPELPPPPIEFPPPLDQPMPQPPAIEPPGSSTFAPPTPGCSVGPAPAPAPGEGEGPRGGGLWCVAKPTVPEEKLQEALDYACGEGGADCEAIGPDGSCYEPDTVVAHASYAFNSYWQKAKQSGGTCGFDGTAVLIVSDPSYLQCRFVLN